MSHIRAMHAARHRIRRQAGDHVLGLGCRVWVLTVHGLDQRRVESVTNAKTPLPTSRGWGCAHSRKGPRGLDTSLPVVLGRKTVPIPATVGR